MLDPFLKRSQSQNFSDYSEMFEHVTYLLPSIIEKEFAQYLVGPASTNPYIGILEYWKDISVLYPTLAKVTLL